MPGLPLATFDARDYSGVDRYSLGLANSYLGAIVYIWQHDDSGRYLVGFHKPKVAGYRLHSGVQVSCGNSPTEYRPPYLRGRWLTPIRAHYSHGG